MVAPTVSKDTITRLTKGQLDKIASNGGAQAAAHEVEEVLSQVKTPGAMVTQSLSQGSTGVMETALGVGYKAQNVMFTGGLFALPIVGGIASFLGSTTVMRWARNLNPMNFMSRTFRETLGGAAKVAELVPERVKVGVGGALDSVGKQVAPVVGQADVATKGWGIVKWLNGKAQARGLKNLNTSTQLFENAQKGIAEYTAEIGKLQIDDATRQQLLGRVTNIQNTLNGGIQEATSSAAVDAMRRELRGLQKDLHSVADATHVAGYKNAGAGIANAGRSAWGKVSNFFTKDGFKQTFSKSAPKAATIASADGLVDVRGLADSTAQSSEVIRKMGETAAAAGTDMTAKGWMAARPKVMGNITLQEGMTAGIQTLAFAMATKRLVKQSGSAIDQLKEQYKDLTGKEASTRKILFGGDLPETVRQSRNRMLGSTAPGIVGNFALFAVTMFFQRRMKFMHIMGLQIGGAFALDALFKPDFGTNHYAEMKTKFKNKENLTPQNYIDLICSMDKTTAKTKNMHGGTIPASEVAYYCAFNQIDPVDVFKMVEASRTNKLAAKEWADGANAIVAAHNAEQAKLAQPQVAVEQSTPQQLETAKAGIPLDNKPVLGMHTAKAVKEAEARATTRGAVLA